jgi:hypothetical protein
MGNRYDDVAAKYSGKLGSEAETVVGACQIAGALDQITESDVDRIIYAVQDIGYADRDWRERALGALRALFAVKRAHTEARARRSKRVTPPVWP